MRRARRVLLPSLLLGLMFIQAGCRSESHPWIPPQSLKATIASDPTFVRTSQGDYVDGYLAHYESDFQKQQMFMVVEIPHYLKGERLIVTGRFVDDSVRISCGGQSLQAVRVFLVERAKPNVPLAPDVPSLK